MTPALHNDCSLYLFQEVYFCSLACIHMFYTWLLIIMKVNSHCFLPNNVLLFSCMKYNS